MVFVFVHFQTDFACIADRSYDDDGQNENEQVAQRHQKVNGTIALPKAVVLKLDISRAAGPIGDDVL